MICFNEIYKNNNEIENINETNLFDFIKSTVKDYETNDEMNFNDPNIKNHKDHDDEIDLINFNKSDIIKQKNENSNENNKEGNNSWETVTFYDDLKVILT